VLTDDTGILQHATCSTPDLHHGYCTDDNARALVAGVMFCDLWPDLRLSGAAAPASPEDLLIPMQRYLAFLSYAFNPATGRFKNFMGYGRTWLEEVGSEDSHARTIWALGEAVRFGPNADIQELADQLLRKALPAVSGFPYLRPWAYCLLGLDEYLRSGADNELAAELRRTLGQRLFDIWKEYATPEWPWWEDHLTWGNAKLPHALLIAGAALGREDMVEAALTAMRWLLAVQAGDAGQLSVIGNRGWYERGRMPARFAQQPIEAKGLVQACLAAAAATRNNQWTQHAARCFEWFLGRNDLKVPLYNAQTGGCQDGLEAEGPNANQGAESTLAYIISVLELRHYARMQRAERDIAPSRSAEG
jgi:hypothetical protein